HRHRGEKQAGPYANGPSQRDAEPEGGEFRRAHSPATRRREKALASVEEVQVLARPESAPDFPRPQAALRGSCSTAAAVHAPGQGVGGPPARMDLACPQTPAGATDPDHAAASDGSGNLRLDPAKLGMGNVFQHAVANSGIELALSKGQMSEIGDVLK